MSPSFSPNPFEEFRALAASDPRQARIHFCAILDEAANNDGYDLEEFLCRLAAPGEGRLRQIVANAVRIRPDKARVHPHLQKWLETETDEFARRAIQAALVSGAEEKIKGRRPPQRTPIPMLEPYLVEAYRYASSRINHQIRNALLEPATSVLKLRRLTLSVQDEVARREMAITVEELMETLVRVGRVVESDVEDDFFRWKAVSLCEWIEAMTVDYGRKYKALVLSINSCPVKVHANDHLLTTLFWNLWINAQQAVEGPCQIKVQVEVKPKEVNLLITDNGEGFMPALAGIVFHERHSTHGISRGRGLLEAQDAVEQLKGRIQLVEHEGAHRVKITLPLRTTL